MSINMWPRAGIGDSLDLKSSGFIPVWFESAGINFN